MEELRLTFLIFGALAIVGILAHGLWTVRKKRNAQQDSAQPAHLNYRNYQDDNRADADFDLGEAQPDSESFDDLGLGPVRVVKVEPKMYSEDNAAVSSRDDSPASGNYSSNETGDATFTPSQNDQSKAKTSAAREDRGVVESEDLPEPPSFLLRTGAGQNSQSRKEPVIGDIQANPTPSDAGRREPISQTNTPGASRDESVSDSSRPDAADTQKTVRQGGAATGSLAEQARKLVQRKKSDITRAAPTKRREPKLGGQRLGEDQMRIDFDDEPQSPPEPPTQQPSEAKTVSQEVLVLNVKAPGNNPIPGSSLLPSLLTLGFKFGDQDIFHRHVNSNGKGPVLFSLANMFKPGVFDIDNMENFNTQGVSLFMILPIEGDPHQVFNMMHNAARKLADEFGAQVLDGRRSALTKQSLQQYVEKIREFERQRMIKRAN